MHLSLQPPFIPEDGGCILTRRRDGESHETTRDVSRLQPLILVMVIVDSGTETRHGKWKDQVVNQYTREYLLTK